MNKNKITSIFLLISLSISAQANEFEGLDIDIVDMNAMKKETITDIPIENTIPTVIEKKVVKKTIIERKETIDDLGLDEEEEINEVAPSFLKKEVVNTALAIKPTPNVKYSKEAIWYSEYKGTKKEFKNYMTQNSWTTMLVQNNINKNNTLLSLEVNALYYDYVKKNAGLADYYYKEYFNYPTKNKKNILMKLRYTDFLLRTNRLSKLSPNILKKSDCFTNTFYKKECLYMLGLNKYFTTGMPKQKEFRLIQKSHKKANLIYNQ